MHDSFITNKVQEGFELKKVLPKRPIAVTHIRPGEEASQEVLKGYTTYLGHRKLNYMIRLCTFRLLSYVELEIKKNAMVVANKHLENHDFFSFNKFLLLKFIEKINWLAPDNFSLIYLNFCVENKNLKQMFQVEKQLLVINPNESLSLLGEKNKNFYTFPEPIAKQFVSSDDNSNGLSGFIALLIMEKCIEAQLFTKPFLEFKNRKLSNNKNLAIVSKNFLQQVEKNPLVFTICFNDFLDQMGFSPKATNRKMLEKALNQVYDMSFTARCDTRQIQVKQRLITTLHTYNIKQKKFADLHMNADSFFYVLFKQYFRIK